MVVNGAVVDLVPAVSLLEAVKLMGRGVVVVTAGIVTELGLAEGVVRGFLDTIQGRNFVNTN